MKDQAALLIIDVQIALFARKDFDGKAIYHDEQLLANIRQLIDKARASDTPVFYMQHTVVNDPYMGEGTPLWEIHPLIKPEEEDTVIVKYHPDSFWDTHLDNLLQAFNVRKLVICGVQTEFCVDTTCRRAASLGYNTVLVSDGHGTWDSDVLTGEQIVAHHNQTLGSMFVELKPASEIEF